MVEWRWPAPSYFPWQENAFEGILNYALPRTVASSAPPFAAQSVMDSDDERAAAALLVWGTEALLACKSGANSNDWTNITRSPQLRSAQAGQLRALSLLSQEVTRSSILAAHQLCTGTNRGFRDGAVWMGGSGPLRNAATVAPPPGLIERYVENLIEVWPLLHPSRTTDLAFLHLQLTSIHPFWDGNGRMARLLVAAKRLQRGSMLDACAVISLVALRRGQVARAHRAAQNHDLHALQRVWQTVIRDAKCLVDDIKISINGVNGPTRAGYHPLWLAVPDSFPEHDVDSRRRVAAQEMTNSVLTHLRQLTHAKTGEHKD